MPVRWNLKQWLAAEHQIYRSSELQALLEEKAGLQLSLQAISSLLNNVPNGLRLSTIQALCNALDCTLSDFCEVLPDQTAEHEHSQHAPPYKPPWLEPSPAGTYEALMRSPIHAAIRDIVMQTLAEQELIPHRAQRSAARRSTISVLIPGWVWQVIPDLTRSIVESITESAYDLTLYSMSEENPKNDEHALIERFLASPLSAGLIAIFPGRLSSTLTQLSQQGFPVVVIDDQEIQIIPCIGVDNVKAAHIAVRHLISLGHQRIAHIKGPAQFLVSYARYQGYCRALLEAGLFPEPELVFEGDFLPPSGRACVSKLMQLPPEKRPTAIFAASDQMAYGVLAAAEEFGLAVPGDIALVGFDDDRPSAYTRPALTTVRQPYFEMGKQSINLLLSLLKAPAPFSNKEVLRQDTPKAEMPIPSSRQQLTQVQLQAELVVRESCGANYRSVIEPSPTSTLS